MSSACCFGVEPRTDGSIVVAAQSGDTVSVERFEPEQAESAAVVRFVRDRSSSPRVCVASNSARALGLALAFGELPEAEVILIRPAAFTRTGAAQAESASADNVARALARYARRAA